jgi:hypothetical protein
MKRLALTGIILLLAFGAGAQKTIDTLNGYDWMGLSDEGKVGTIRGFFLSCTATMYMAYEVNKASGMSQENLDSLMSKMENQFSYSETVGAMCRKLDDFYASPSTRSYLLYRTIPYLAGKEWWNRKTGQVDVPSNGGGS